MNLHQADVPCPEAAICQTCRCAAEDDVCWPGERASEEALRSLCSRLRDLTRHTVWVCAGCDECEPTPGVRRSLPMPCTDKSPSMNGSNVVEWSDIRKLIQEVEAR